MALIELAATSLEKRDNIGTGLHEIVMGLHWDPAEPGGDANVSVLDALCVLFDAGTRVLDIIHSGHLRNANESVVHTGDSLTGASVWDDERIFVFLDALPDEVQTLAFVIVSANGRSLHLAPGAYCHISDQYTEQEILHLDFSTLLECQVHAAGGLCRSATGWNLIENASSQVGEALLAELRERARLAKNQTKDRLQIVG